MITRARWLGGWGLIAGTYLVLALVRGLGSGDLRSTLVGVVAATVTFAFATAVLSIMVPRHRGGEGGPNGGGAGAGGEEPPPPWWPEFEREFRRHVALSCTDGTSGRKDRESREPTPVA